MGSRAPADPDGGRPPSEPPAAGAGPNSFWHHVSRVIDRFGDLLAFVAVPVLASLLEIENVRRLVGSSPRGVTVNVEFAVPFPLSDLWTFVDPPDGVGHSTPGSSGGDQFSGSSVPAGGTGTDTTVDLPYESVRLSADAVTADSSVVIGLVLLVYAAISAVLMAIYVGGIDRRLRDRPASVGECVRRYAFRFFGYQVVVFGIFLASIPFLLADPALFVLAFPVAIVAMYLFYATPFLFVVADAPFVEAFARSYRMAVAFGAHLRFALWHACVTAAVSLGLSLVVTGGGLAALVVGLAVACPLGLVLTAATTSFLRERVADGGESAVETAY